MFRPPPSDHIYLSIQPQLEGALNERTVIPLTHIDRVGRGLHVLRRRDTDIIREVDLIDEVS